MALRAGLAPRRDRELRGGPLSQDRWQRLDALFHAALGLDGMAREQYLEAACGDDPRLRAEVARLLAADERVGRFIERPLLASAAADTDDAPMPSGRRIGPYGIVREIGRGGMGAVYLAERVDGLFEQRVAVKLIKRGMDTELVLRQFRSERQILASLEHPNIARLLDGGTTEDGLPYFIMECVEGRAINDYADSRQLTVSERVRLFLQVAEAVAFAHGRRVVHRDIKPGNILVTADGTPKLLDFGIAKVLGLDDGERTGPVTGLRLLTPEYASPEQVQGATATEVSDVYSLGVVLYELLTGRSPYRPRSRDPFDLIEAVRTGDPDRPSRVVDERLRRELRGDLDAIVLTALRKEPARRYQSVALLMEDLWRHLDGRPVHARPDRLLYRTGKFVGRNRAAVVVGIGAVAALVAMGIATARSRTTVSPTGSGLLAPRDRILVADVIAPAGDSELGAAVTEAMRVALTESPVVRVLSVRQVRATLEQMERPPDAALVDSVAQEVAVRNGAKAIVSGRVSRVASRYVITAELVRAETGDLLTAAEETAADSNDVIPAVGRLTDRLRGRLGESLASIRQTLPLSQVTTPSLEALRLYTEGFRLATRGERERGARLLERATQLDTGFASAYRALATTYGAIAENGRAAAAMDRALAHENRLPFIERYLMRGVYTSGGLGDHASAMAIYRTILARYPDDIRALNNLGWEYGKLRQYAMQDSVLTHAVIVDSTVPSVQQLLVEARIDHGDFDGARRALDRLEQRFPGSQVAREAEVNLAAGRQDWTAAEWKARELIAAERNDSLTLLDAYDNLADILASEGRVAEAERISRQMLAMALAVTSPGRYLGAALRLAWIDLRYRHTLEAAVTAMGRELRRMPLDSIAESERPYYDLARFFGAAGQPARARALIAQAREWKLDRLRHNPNRHWALGIAALAERRLDETRTELRAAADSSDCPICVLPDLARFYESVSEPDSAIAVYQRYLTTPWESRFESDATELLPVSEHLAQLYLWRGDTTMAVETCAGMLRIWHGADRELQPALAEVRRIATLRGEAAGQ